MPHLTVRLGEARLAPTGGNVDRVPRQRWGEGWPDGRDTHRGRPFANRLPAISRPPSIPC